MQPDDRKYSFHLCIVYYNVYLITCILSTLCIKVVINIKQLVYDYVNTLYICYKKNFEYLLIMEDCFSYSHIHTYSHARAHIHAHTEGTGIKLDINLTWCCVIP